MYKGSRRTHPIVREWQGWEQGECFYHDSWLYYTQSQIIDRLLVQYKREGHVGKKERRVKLCVAFWWIIENNNQECLFELVVQPEQRHNLQPGQKLPNSVWLLYLVSKPEGVNSSEESSNHSERECWSLLQTHSQFAIKSGVLGNSIMPSNTVNYSISKLPQIPRGHGKFINNFNSPSL